MSEVGSVCRVGPSFRNSATGRVRRINANTCTQLVIDDHFLLKEK